jgi:hypothetical protein
MWFFDQILAWLNTIKSWFLTAYYEVSGWVWPFNNLATPLWEIYYAFIYLVIYFRDFRDWVNDTANRLLDIIGYDEIYSYFSTFINYATNAWSWVLNAWSNVTAIINTWWSSASLTVQSWIDYTKEILLLLYDELRLQVIALEALWAQFLDWIPTLSEIISWYANAWGWILSHILAWGGLSASSILALILSTLKEWFPWYDDLAAIWDQIVAFFVAPWDWLQEKFVNWWLGPE